MIGVFLQLGERRDDAEAVRDGAELVADRPSARGRPTNARRALGVEADEVERRARSCRSRSSCRAGSARGSRAGYCCVPRAAPGPVTCGPPMRAVGSARFSAVGGVVVELVELLRRAVPVADVRLVPDFPVPALDFALAVPLDRVAHPLVDELAPLVVVLRRIRPAGVDRAVAACPDAQSCWYGCGLVDSASGMKPISTSGFIFRST